MKDYSQAKVQLIKEYTSTRKRSDEEVVAFHTGMNYLIDYMSGNKERLNDFVPNSVIYNKRTCVNVNALLQEEYKKYQKQKSIYKQKIVIAIDSFKGCLTSAEAAEAAAKGVYQAIPECEVVCLPIADGGEGMLDVLVATTDGQKISISAHDPLMKPIETCYGISQNKQTAYIEMASICGLTLVPPEKRNPMLTTTYGMGELIRDALDRGCRDFIIGIGGSATNDAGMGMLQALGYRFMDIHGNEMGIGNGEELVKVDSIDMESVHPDLASSRFTVACDVQNSFYGMDGAAYIFAPQKGADQDMVTKLDEGLRNFAGVICWATGKDISNHPGAGAAGGLGGSLLAFLNAELRPGIQLMMDTLNFKNIIKGAEFIVTGEGKADRQTLMGKVPAGILEEARQQNIPVMLIAGSVEDEEALLEAGFKGVFSINPPSVSLEHAMLPEVARLNILKTVAQICASATKQFLPAELRIPM